MTNPIRLLDARRLAAAAVAAGLSAMLGGSACGAPQSRTAPPKAPAPRLPVAKPPPPARPAAQPAPAPAPPRTPPPTASRAADAAGPFWVASWGDAPAGLRNVFPMVWIQGNSVGDEGASQFRPEIVAQQLRALPEGRRAIHPWRYRNAMVWSPAGGHALDRVRSREGNSLLDAPSPFLDHAAAAVRAEFEPFIAEVRRLGGSVDLVIADDESPDLLSGWHLDEAKIRMIMEDPRFSSRDAGDGRTAKEHLGDATAAQVRDPSRRDAMARWNATMSKLAHRHIDEAVFGSVKAQFPQARGSNYSARFVTEANATPDLNGQLVWGLATFGTHSAFPAYGSVRQLATHFAPSPTDPTKLVRGERGIPAEPWTALVADANTARAIRRSSDRGFHAWIADPGWSGDSSGDSLYHESRGGAAYYRENLFHQALAGAELFLYWTPFAPGYGVTLTETALQRQQRHDRVRAVNRMVEELNQRCGFAAVSPIATAALPWNGRAILSGARRADGSAIWRLSVHPEVESVSLAPGGQRLSFPAGTVGAWVETPTAAPLEISEVRLRRPAAVKAPPPPPARPAPPRSHALRGAPVRR